MSDRDKKLLLILVPVVLFVGYWFLLLSPKREEASSSAQQLAKQQDELGKAQLEASQAESARKTFPKDYSAMVRLGKAIPTGVDMPSLVVQLDRASAGTHIDFSRIKAGPRVTGSGGAAGATGASPSGSSASASGSSTSSAPSSSSGSSQSGAPASAAGGQPATTSQGKAVEKANDTKQSQDASAASASNGGATSTAATGAKGGPAVDSGATVPGLDAVPLEFTFKGSFFDLADFFHEMKRFVRTANENVKVNGRLMTISNFTYKGYPEIEATVNAVVYLSPKTEGTTAGATQSGPAPGASPAPSTSTASSGSGSSSSSSTPPAATAGTP